MELLRNSTTGPKTRCEKAHEPHLLMQFFWAALHHREAIDGLRSAARRGRHTYSQIRWRFPVYVRAYGPLPNWYTHWVHADLPGKEMLPTFSQHESDRRVTCVPTNKKPSAWNMVRAASVNQHKQCRTLFVLAVILCFSAAAVECYERRNAPSRMRREDDVPAVSEDRIRNILRPIGQALLVLRNIIIAVFQVFRELCFCCTCSVQT